VINIGDDWLEGQWKSLDFDLDGDQDVLWFDEGTLFLSENVECWHFRCTSALVDGEIGFLS
jgi:hypothetical protein